MKNAIWITWETQIRNRSMAKALKTTLKEIVFEGSRFKRYLLGGIRTFLTIKQYSPKIVFAPNPSIVLTLLLILFKQMRGYTFVTDAHHVGVEAFNGSILLQKILDFCNRRADLVIVTNINHRRYVEKIGGKAFVCQDPLPNIEKYPAFSSFDKKAVFFICSFHYDEPYEKAFEASKLLVNAGFSFFVSGNYKKANIPPSSYPHINFLGFVEQNLFYSTLKSCQVVLDLTEVDDCLVCGGYEAMAAEVPLVTSNKRALREFFTHGTIYTDHDPEKIFSAVKSAYSNKDRLKSEIKDWKRVFIADHEKKIEKLQEEIISI